MPRATTPTLLSLADYARIMGINPLHFSQGVSAILPDATCSQVWYQFAWQAQHNISREGVADKISSAERDIADAIGYWPAPVYVEDEFIAYPTPYKPEYYGRGSNIRGRYKSVQLRRGYVIEGGQRAVELLGTACWAAIDADGDGFTEIAHFQLAVDATLDVCQAKAYFKEYLDSDAENSRTDLASAGADPEWEVRPFKVELVGTTLNIYFWVWDLFRPQLQEELGASTIDADDFGSGPPEDPCDYLAAPDLGVYVDELMFYREYTDPENQVEFSWGSDLSCSATAACAESTQAGCIRVKNPRNGLVIPQPGVYNSVTETFATASWSERIEPDAARIWYLAGWQPESRKTCATLDRRWKQMIVMLATARLEWDLCNCGNARDRSSYWRQDAAMMTAAKSFNLRQDEMSNPFGQRVGEVLAWRQIRNLGRRKGRAIKA